MVLAKKERIRSDMKTKQRAHLAETETETEQANVAEFATKTSLSFTPDQLRQHFPTGIPTEIELLVFDCNWSPDQERQMALHANTTSLSPQSNWIYLKPTRSFHQPRSRLHTNQGCEW
jgi:hypothetical protein